MVEYESEAEHRSAARQRSAAIETAAEFFKRRAARHSLDEFDHILARVPDRPPEPRRRATKTGSVTIRTLARSSAAHGRGTSPSITAGRASTASWKRRTCWTKSKPRSGTPACTGSRSVRHRHRGSHGWRDQRDRESGSPGRTCRARRRAGSLGSGSDLLFSRPLAVEASQGQASAPNR